MKNILILLISLVLLSCTKAKYKVNDKICAYDTELIIISVYTFSGTRSLSFSNKHTLRSGTNYDCKYVDKNGIIQTINIYEKEITPCK